MEVDAATLQVTRIYGSTFMEHETVVYARASGAMTARIPDPADLSGAPSFPRLASDGQRLFQTVAGAAAPAPPAPAARTRPAAV